MLQRLIPRSLAGIAFAAATSLFAADDARTDHTLDRFEPNDSFESVSEIHLALNGERLVAKPSADGPIIYTGDDYQNDTFLVTRQYYSDQTVSLEFMVAPGSQASVYLLGRYELKLSDSYGSDELSPSTAGGITGGQDEHEEQRTEGIPPIVNAAKPAGEWQTLSLKFRSPRFDAARNKTENALLLEAVLNGQTVQKDTPIEHYSDGTYWDWEQPAGQFGILGSRGQIAIRNFRIERANYDPVSVPERGQPSNVDQLVDYVDLGRQTFQAMGCIECHATAKGDTSAKTGPNLYGLFTRSPRKREIVESGGENHRFLVEVDRSYITRSVRSPAAELAIAEYGEKKGEPYLPLMPPFPEETLSDAKVEALWRYLGTLNDHDQQGPTEVLVEKSGPKQYDPLQDTMQVLVDGRTRIQRGSMEGLSGRSIHVGLPNGINYSFDPRVLAIEKLWQGGFLDGTGEWTNRGGYGFAPGYENKEISLGDGGALLAPLAPDGSRIDFSFKEAKFHDWETIAKSLNSKEDHLDMLAKIDAGFEGYELDSSNPDAAPVFKYRVGQNHLAVQTSIDAEGNLSVTLSGHAPQPQRFAFNAEVIDAPSVSAGSIDNGVWTLPAQPNLSAKLTGKLQVATLVWRPKPAETDYLTQPLKTEATQADLPAGYSSEQYLPPVDNYGRTLLFEATGIALAPDGTIVVGTRTAGIWRIVDGQWRLFAQGLFDCLGLVVEDEKGLTIVAGQKPELTRISDTNGDGIADSYQTLTDDFSYHSNYHGYMHGPVRDAEGNYYFNLNLLHADDAIYKAGGKFMGTSGGFRGWTIKLTPDGKFIPWANGLRSPAGLAFAPDGRLWYSENQGEYVGTSKLFVLKKDAFYGHPAGLIDLPGMTPDSPEIQWPAVADRKERAVVLFPHNRVANSPGNPAWDTTGGRFGPFEGQIFIGDQTQSKLLRVVTETVDGIEQGCVIPFGSDLQSGIMRPVFLPDGSLIIGQTGRGWQSWGGKVASIQRIKWDGHTNPPAIHHVRAVADGFDVVLTEPLGADVTEDSLKPQLKATSWIYRDAPDYGSPEIDTIDETIDSVEISADRRSVTFTLAPSAKQTVPRQTARVYHIEIDPKNLFPANAPELLEAYYTRY